MGVVRFVFTLALAIPLINCTQKIDPIHPLDRDIKGNIKGKTTDTPESENWFTKDPELDDEEGVSVDRFYKEKKQNPKPRTIIVAVVDSGVDIEHEDLKNNIWINSGESGFDENGKDKSSNGIDDDHNGYIDDINGWNFLGSYDENGKAIHIEKETLEETRIKKKLDIKISQGMELTEDEKKLHSEVKHLVNTEIKKSQESIIEYNGYISSVENSFKVLEPIIKIKLEELTKDLLEGLKLNSPNTIAAKNDILDLFKKTYTFSYKHLKRRRQKAIDRIDTHYNVDYDPRSEIIKDDPSNFDEKGYGNNLVKGPEGFHGTHVSGIIAALRDNGVGINGIAKNVKIMPVRAVPNGDERDKDVALAIRYAVDNGAHIINMSFGKRYSPFKEKVDEAMLYASQKGVLLVHAAGNNSSDNNQTDFYPQRQVNSPVDGGQTEIESWIEVGASANSKGQSLVARFSNFGSRSVDVFAPGNNINSLAPDNKYSIASGTSMAAPTTSGVLAVMLSESPNMSGVEAKLKMLDNVRKYPALKVYLPKPWEDNTKEFVLFDDLSITGGIVHLMY